MSDLLALYAPRRRFLALLAQGWELPFVVEPMPGGHGAHSILLTRPLVGPADHAARGAAP